jgi:hypothetical protein
MSDPVDVLTNIVIVVILMCVPVGFLLFSIFFTI